MRRCSIRIVGFCLFSLTTAYSAAAQGAFVLEDQFGGKQDISRALQSGLCVVAAGNARDAPARLARWKEALLASRLADAPTLLVCDMSGVPFFVPKATIMKGLQKEFPDTRFLLDWKGELRKRVSIEKSEIAVALFRDGAKLASVTGDAEPSKANELASGL